MPEYDLTHPAFPQGVIFTGEVPPTEQDVWDIARDISRPYSLTKLPDPVKIAAAKHGFFPGVGTPREEEEPGFYSLAFGEAEDDPETEIDERETGLVQQLIETGQAFFREQLYNPTSARRKLNLIEKRLKGGIEIPDDDPQLAQYLEAGRWLTGLQKTWESTGPFGSWEPEGKWYVQSLKQAGLKDSPEARKKLIWAALHENLLQSKVDLYQGMIGGPMTGLHVYAGGRKMVNKWTVDEADDESLLDYANAAIDLDHWMYVYDHGAEYVADLVGDEEAIERLGVDVSDEGRGAVQSDPEMGLAWSFALDPMMYAGGGVARTVSAGARVGLGGQILKTVQGLEANVARRLELKALERARMAVLPRTVQPKRLVEELAKVESAIAKQTATLEKYGGKNKLYNLGTLGLRASPESVMEAAGKALNLETEAGILTYKMAAQAVERFGPSVGRRFLDVVAQLPGGAVELPARLALAAKEIPESTLVGWMMKRAHQGGKEITEEEAKATIRKALALGAGVGGGVGYVSGMDLQDLGAAGGIGLLTAALGPKILKITAAGGRDLRTLGHEWSLSRTKDPFFTRLDKLATSGEGLAGAAIDRSNMLNQGWWGGVKAGAREAFPEGVPLRQGATEAGGLTPGTLSPVTGAIAKFLGTGAGADVGRALETFGAYGKGVSAGTAVPAGLGYVAHGGEPEGALAGAIFSLPFTAVGSGLGMLARFNKKADLIRKEFGDVEYVRDHMTKIEKADFDAMPSEARLATASAMLSYPDLVIIGFRGGKDGERGSYQVTEKGPVIKYNVDVETPVKYIVAHELGHHIEAHGLTPMVNRILFGSAELKEPGVYVKGWDEAGNPIFTEEFAGKYNSETGVREGGLRNEYMERLRVTRGLSPEAMAAYEADYAKIGREVFADHYADTVTNPRRRGDLAKILYRGPMMRLLEGVADRIAGPAFLKNMLLKMGIPLDAKGKPFVGSRTGLFKDLKRVPELDALIKKYLRETKGKRAGEIIGVRDPRTGELKTERASHPLDDAHETTFTVGDQSKPNVMDVLNTGGIFKTGPDGKPVTDMAGNPKRLTKKELEKLDEAASEHALKVLEKHGVPIEEVEGTKGGVKVIKKSASFHNLTEAMIDDLALGPWHPRQIETLRKIAGALREGDGPRAGFIISQFPASTGGKPRALPITTRAAFPYRFKLTQGGNILVELLDVPQMDKNLRFLRSDNKRMPARWRNEYERLFGSEEAVRQAFLKYGENLANDRPGETGLGENPKDKMNFLNALVGGADQVHVEMNPILRDLGWKLASNRSNRSPFGPAVKTFRIDRIFKVERSGELPGFKYERFQRLMLPREGAPGAAREGERLFMPAEDAGAPKGEGERLYMPAAKAGDEILARRLVADEAIRKGFTSVAEVKRGAVGKDWEEGTFVPESGLEQEVVFHGSPDVGFREFEVGRPKSHDWSVSTGEAIHLSTERHEARTYRQFIKEPPTEFRPYGGKWVGEIRPFYLKGKYWDSSAGWRNLGHENRSSPDYRYRLKVGAEEGYINRIEENGAARVTPATKKWLESKGFAGIVQRNMDTGFVGSIEFAVFDPKNIKSADAVTYDKGGEILPLGKRFSESADVYYMPAGDRPLGLSDNIRDVVLPGIRQDKFSRGQLEAALGKTAGARAYADEIGLIDWLKDRKSVTKAEVDAFVDANAPRLEEINSIGGEPRFSEYQEPGGTNYREVVVKLPRKEDKVYTEENVIPIEPSAKQPIQRSRFGRFVGRDHNENWYFETPDGVEVEPKWVRAVTPPGRPPQIASRSQAEALRNILEKKQPPSTENYHEPHFNEDNVLLHLRLNDRIDADGKKVMFIEELQSAWHQKGRKEGYQGQAFEMFRKRVMDAARRDGGTDMALVEKAFNHLAEEPLNTVARPTAREWQILQNAIGKEQIDLNYFHDRHSDHVPDAPFKKNWPALGLKRAIKEAIENGYDRIAWLDGEGQAARYDLSRHVDAIEVIPEPGGTYEIMARPVDQMGGEFRTLATKVPKEKLADHIGKEPAQKALEKIELEKKQGEEMPLAHLEGLDLKVGGEGMKAFYDRELVSIANKISKKIGGEKVTSPPWTRREISDADFGFHILDLPKNPQAVENLRLYMPAEKIPSDGRAPELIYEIDKKGQTMLPFKKGFPAKEEKTTFAKEWDRDAAEAGEPLIGEGPPPRDDWRAGNVRSKEAWGRDKLYMPAPEDASPNTVSSWGDGDSPSFPAGYRRGQAKSNEEVAKLFQEKYVEKYGEPIDPYDYGPEAVEWLADMLASEGEGALKRTGSAVDWYTTAVERAMTIAEEIFPEIKTSAEAKDRFLGALAITSQNMRVLDNAKAAVYQYEHKAKHGKFDYDIAHGGKAPAITDNLRAFDKMESGMTDFHGFLDRDYTVRELTQFGKKFFGDKKFTIDGRMDDAVKGSAVFGPKIGQGFFQNLKGNYDPVTIDLWMRRTFGRLTGRSVDVSLSPKAIGRLIYSHRKNTGRRKTDFDLPDFLRGLKISGSISKDGKINYKISDRTFERLFGEHEQGAANADAVFSLAGRLSKEWERRFSGAGRDVTKAKSELQARKEDGRPTKQASARLAKAEAEKSKLQAEKPSWAYAATSISGKLKPIDIPTPQERAVIVQAFGRALTKLRDKGYDLTPADLQATLWYPEKDIWSFLKGDKADALNMSYDQAMEKIRDAR